MRNVNVKKLVLCTLVGYTLSAGVAQAERVKLVVATTGRDPDVNIVQDYGDVRWSDVIAKEFQRQYPNVDVEFVTMNTQKITVLIATGQGPDIINDYGGGFINLGRQGAFVDLVPLLKRDGIDYLKNQTFWEPQYKAFEWQGQQFALPQYLGTLAMYYNADMFDAMGIVRPSPSLTENKMDWAEFEALVKKLTRDTNGDGQTDIYGFDRSWSSSRTLTWTLAAGAEYYVNGDKSRSALNSAAAVRGLEFLQNLRWGTRGMVTPGVSASWDRGQVAIHEDGSWKLVNRLGVQKDGSPKVPFAWNVFPMPIGPSGKRATMANIDGYAINKNTKHLDEAFALLKFLAGVEGNTIMAKYVALQPANRRVVPEYIRLMRAMNRNVSEIDVHVFTDAGPYAYPQYLYSNYEAADSIIVDAVRRIMDKNEPARSVWMEAIERLNRILQSATRHIEVSEPTVVSWEGAQWTRQDFNVAVGGSATFRSGKLVLSAAGSDIWGVRDGFGFLYQKVKGNFTATVRLHEVPRGNTWSKAGIMVRAAASASSAQAMIVGTGANGVRVQFRPEELGESVSANGKYSWTNGDPVFLRVTRKGGEVTMYVSSDGAKWSTVDRVRVHLPDEVLVGLAVTSHVSAEPGEAVFSDWKLTRD